MYQIIPSHAKLMTYYIHIIHPSVFSTAYSIQYPVRLKLIPAVTIAVTIQIYPGGGPG